MACLSHFRKNLWPFALIILAVGATVYYRVFHFQFLPLWDDAGHVLNVYEIRFLNWQNLIKIFSTSYVGMYQPITTLTYALDYQIWGLSSSGFHLTNLLLHLISGFLVFFVLDKFTRNTMLSFFFALVFVVHPVQVEAIAWIAARNTILSTIFFLSAVYTYIKYLENNFKTRFLIFTFSLFVLSALSKGTTVTFPLIMILIDYLYSRKPDLRLILEKIPFFLISIFIGLIAINVRSADGQISDATNQFSGITRFFIILNSIITYLSKVILPVNYSAYYTYPVSDPGNLDWGNQIFPIIIFLALSTFIFLHKKTDRKKLIFGSLFFLATLCVTLKFVLVGLQLMADRYLYLPMIGLFLFVMLSVEKALKYRLLKIATYCIAVLLFVYYVFTTTTYLQYWENEEMLFAQTIKISPDAVPVKNLIGIRQKNSGDVNRAMKTFNEIITHYPNYGSTYNNRGNLWRSVNHLDLALRDYQTALQFENRAIDSSSILTNIGIVYAMQNNLNMAIKYFDKALQVNHENAQAYYNLGNVNALKGNFKEACNNFDKAIQINAEFGQAYYARGLAEFHLNLIEKANSDFAMSKKLGISVDETIFNQPGRLDF